MFSKALEHGADSQCDFINHTLYQVTEKTHIFNKHFNKPHGLFYYVRLLCIDFDKPAKCTIT